jgi:hypothetical protein
MSCADIFYGLLEQDALNGGVSTSAIWLGPDLERW